MTVSTRSVAVAPAGSLPVSRMPTTSGHEHVDRLAEHDALGLDAADAPADDAEAVDHRRVAVGADERVGNATAPFAILADEDALGQVLEVDLVNDAGARRHNAEVVERLLAPAEELVALAVALELEFDVQVERRRPAKWSTCTEWSITRSAGTSGLILPGSPPKSLHRAAHRGQVDHARHAGEVLQDDPGRFEGDLHRARFPSSRPTPRAP